MLVSFQDVFKSYNGAFILENLNFQIEPGEKIGLIGANGAGKTTLLRLLTGQEDPDSGQIGLQKGLSVGYLRQNDALDTTKTIAQEMRQPFAKLDEAYNSMRAMEEQMKQTAQQVDQAAADEYARLQSFFETNDGYNINIKIETVLGGMGFAGKDRQTVIATLSGGEKTRLALAKLLLQNPQLLLLDEPTNHLDFKTLRWLEEYLCSYRGAVLAVSHDRFFLDKLTGRIYEIERKKLETYKGNYTSYLMQKKQRYERRMKEYQLQQEKIADLKDYVARNLARASTAASARSRQKELERMEIIEKPKPPLPCANFRFQGAYETGKEVLSVKDLALSVGEGVARKQLFSQFSLELRKGEKAAIIGANGVGKTSFLRAVQGLLSADAGKIVWGRNVKLSYFEQEGRLLDPENTVIDELWKRNPRKNQLEIRSALGQVLLTGENVFKKVGVVSGGERARLNFAMLMFEQANVLLLDEPTNHLDLATKEALEQALCAYEGTVILVSHDRYLLSRVPTQILEFAPGGITVHPGNYHQYLAAQEQAEPSCTPAREAASPEKGEARPAPGYRGKRQRAETARRSSEKRRLQQLADELEERIGRAEEDMTQPEVYGDFQRMNELCAQLEADKQSFEEVFEELIALEDEPGC